MPVWGASFLIGKMDPPHLYQEALVLINYGHGGPGMNFPAEEVPFILPADMPDTAAHQADIAPSLPDFYQGEKAAGQSRPFSGERGQGLVLNRKLHGYD